MLADLAARDIGPYLTIEIMPQGGYTETVDAEAITAPALWEMIKQAAEDTGPTF